MVMMSVVAMLIMMMVVVVMRVIMMVTITVVVTMIVRVAMGMIVPGVTMRGCVGMRMLGIGAAFGIERRFDLDDTGP
ncbi:hypothetical protein BraRD5C2_04580 [Bradyrhizobium sp. RD5-C2]|nr:hypothetical protein BraRD5C2_04580 [Bradyrhizobium sp. RD5-C2]